MKILYHQNSFSNLVFRFFNADEELGQSHDANFNLKFTSKDECLKRKSEITMELYWVQQAIESRRNYLLLKKKMTS